MMLVVTLAGVAGFLTSAGLLWTGLTLMPVRYGTAALVGYGLFVSLVNRWLNRTAKPPEHSVVETATDIIDVPGVVLRGGGRVAGRASEGLFRGGSSGGAGASASFDAGGVASAPVVPVPLPASGGSGGSSWMPDVDLDDDAVKLLPIIAVVAIAIGLFAAGSVIWSAPQLLAEILVDAAVAGGAYRRLKTADLTGGVIKRTWKPMLAIFLTVVCLGAAGHYLKPGADSIGDFFSTLR